MCRSTSPAAQRPRRLVATTSHLSSWCATFATSRVRSHCATSLYWLLCWPGCDLISCGWMQNATRLTSLPPPLLALIADYAAQFEVRASRPLVPEALLFTTASLSQVDRCVDVVLPWLLFGVSRQGKPVSFRVLKLCLLCSVLRLLSDLTLLRVFHACVLPSSFTADGRRAWCARFAASGSAST